MAKTKESGEKKFKNAGSRVFHLAPRVKGAVHFAFGPGDVIEAASESEAAYLESVHEVVEYKGEPPTDKEVIASLTKENAELKATIEKLQKKG